MAALKLEANEEITLSDLFKKDKIPVNEYIKYDFEITDILSGVIVFSKRLYNREDSKAMSKILKPYKVPVEGGKQGIYLLKTDLGCSITYNVYQINSK